MPGPESMAGSDRWAPSQEGTGRGEAEPSLKSGKSCLHWGSRNTPSLQPERVSEATGTRACVGVHTCAGTWVGVCSNVCAHVDMHACVLDACLCTNEVCTQTHACTHIACVILCVWICVCLDTCTSTVCVTRGWVCMHAAHRCTYTWILVLTHCHAYGSASRGTYSWLRV